jgi:hypothetical protein
VRRSRLTTRQLSYFVALAETGGFTRAAERMGVSQPSLSQQIRGFEDVIGAPLLERGGPPDPDARSGVRRWNGRGASCWSWPTWSRCGPKPATA